MKRQPSEWEKIFVNEETDRILIFKIHKQLMPLKMKKKKNSTQSTKWYGEIKDISPKKVYRWPIGT